MDDYIKRVKVLDAISEWLMKALHSENMNSYNEGERAAYRTVLNEVAGLPADDVRPVVRGYWKSVPHKRARVCSRCEADEPYKFADVDANVYNYCPHCGAWMEGKEQW